MTVKELMEKLEKCPEDLDVHISLNGDDIAPAAGVIVVPWMYEDCEPLYVEIFNDGDSEDT